MNRPLLALLLVSSILLLGISFASAYTDQSTYFSCDNCSDCNDALDNTTYNTLQLSTNINGSACITLDVENYTINCAGYEISGTGTPSIGISVTEHNTTITSCTIRDFPQGIVISSLGDKATITNNTIINSTTEGIYVNGPFANINNNNITGSYQGIEVRETGAIITNNDYSGNYKDLYLSTSSSNASVTNNRFIGNGTNYGIDGRVTIRGHNITNNTLTNYTHCIYSDGSTGIGSTIRSNTLTSCIIGIIGDSDDEITNNTISQSTTGILLGGTSSASIIINNTVSSGTTGLSINGSSHTVSANTLTNNAKGLEVSGTSNTIANNTITGSGTVGISLINSVTALIYNNFFNNTDNKDIVGSGTNYWNTVYYNAINIVGYGVMGGNAWFTPIDGFSLNCDDENKSGICDDFTGSVGNVDYIPLSLQGQAPTLTEQYPGNNAYNDSSDPATQTFNCSAEDNYTLLSSISLFIWNASGNITYSDTNSASGNRSNTSWEHLELANGTYTWNCEAIDLAGISDWGTNFTYQINYSDNETPNVTAQTPADGYENTNGVQVLQTFVCLAEDNYDLGNMSLYLTDASNTSFLYNQSTTLNGTSDSHIFTQMIGQGNYTWNCLIYDENGNLDWGDNHTLYVNGSRSNVTNLNTNESFDTITDAIADPNTLDNHTLSIPVGEFYENVNVNKALTLRGQGATSQIGASTMSNPVFTITSDNVTLDNLKIYRARTSIGVTASDVKRLRLTNLTIQENDEGIILENITTLTIQSVSFSNSNTSINASLLTNPTLQSITARARNRTAIHLRDSTALTMTSVTADNTNATAILLENITSGTLTSITTRNNINGLVLNSATDLTLVTATSTGNNNSGIRLINSGSNSLGGVTATGNNYGIYVQASSFVTVSNSRIKSNARGLVLNDSDGSIITDNNISLNRNIGLLVLSTTNADIYDNYFGNNNNTYDTGLNEYHSTGSGTNIIGGSSIGGNYHGTENGTSCSASAAVNDTDNDRVADVGTCSIAGGTSVDGSPLTFNYVPPPATNITSGGGGGGGGGGYSAPPITKHTFVTVLNNVEAGDEILWSLTSSRPIVRQLTFKPKKGAERLELSIGQYDLNIEPDIAPEPLADAVRYLKIDPIGLASKDAEDVEFLMDLPTGKDMFIHDNGAWVPLKKTKEENYWRVESPHMSWFAIGPEGGGTTPPTPNPGCGDGIVDTNELCDGANLNGATCGSRITGTTGSLTCTNTCTFNTNACTTPPPACTKSCGTDGTCNSLCAADTLCSTDPDCSAPPSCPYSCVSNGVCVPACTNTNACIPDPDCALPANEEKPGSMFGMILWVLLGILVLGGGGAAAYFLLKKDDVTSMFPSAGTNNNSGGTGGAGSAGLPNTMLKEDGPNIIGASGGSDSFSTGAEIIPDSVVSWAHQRLTEGYSPDDVKVALVKKGWTTTHAHEAVSKAEKFKYDIL